MENNPPLLLASGLSIAKGHSFTRQLDLLGTALRNTGTVEVITVGRGEPRVISEAPPRLDTANFGIDTMRGLAGRFGFRQAILIGYPDQFPFLNAVSLDSILDAIYFWTQVSRPVPPAGFLPDSPKVTAVPLTAMTGRYLSGGGFRTGPVIPHGVDTGVFAPAAPCSRRREAPVLLSVSANSRRKRFDLLLTACDIAAESLPGIELIIKTDASSKEGGFDLPVLIRSLKNPERVKIVTHELQDRELAALYNRADFYIHTAEWEGFGLPAVEAMACGLPVITHAGQGPGETVPYAKDLGIMAKQETDGGTVLTCTDPRSVAEALIALWSSGGNSELRRMSEAGRRTAVESFDIVSVARRWLDLTGFLGYKG